jgi:DNA polymerase-3 subunit epsilon/ribonuclease T
MRLVFVDLETGGLDPAKHPVIQIAAIAVGEDLKPLEEFEAKINFDLSTADGEALAVNSYNAAVWDRDAKSAAHVCGDLSEFFKRYADVKLVSKRTGRPYYVAQPIGHNAARFDGPFLQDMFLPAYFRVMDTFQRAIFHFYEHSELPAPDDFELGTLCRHFNIPLDGAHDALADVRATLSLYAAILQASMP